MEAQVIRAAWGTDEDRRYGGSRFSEVRNAIFANPYQKVWGGDDEPRLPVYDVTLASLLRGVFPPGRRSPFREATERSVDSAADLRWGADRKGFRRLLHPNGVCLTGQWEITEETEYSGFFRKRSRALVVARYSTCCTETRKGHARSLAMAGKLFPTVDPNHALPLRTASFITQQDIGGDYSESIRDVELRNAPDTRAWRRGAGGLPILLITGMMFLRVDKEPSIRQLYSIAELGEPKGRATRAPLFMRLLVEQARTESESADFRDEIMAQIFDRGDPMPKRSLVFRIDVTDEGTTHGPRVYQRRTFRNWRPIGRLTFDDAVISYNGDHVIHFNHPTWRSDPNDPATATRVGARKVR